MPLPDRLISTLIALDSFFGSLKIVYLSLGNIALCGVG
jgi:hypothetical protein